MRFSKPWRPYQARVFEELPHFLKDRNFHLVAAPGSGKTVVGLEVLRRIGAPTLIFAPTIAIREQWIARLKHDFLAGGEPDWLSRDLASPGVLTISTYQSLSSEFRKEGGMERVTSALDSAGVSTLVVDEAHHLRAAWWKCLSVVKDSLSDVTVVALTATPPIDVPAAEWNRYASFCGAVDIEVGVPELVAEGNICPHQDFVLFSVPTGKDVEDLVKFHQGVSRFVLDLQLDIELAEDLGVNSPVEWISEVAEPEFLKQNQTFYLALSIFLHQSGGYIPAGIREAFRIEGSELPQKLDLDWAGALLQGILFEFREHIETTDGIDPTLPTRLGLLETKLRELGAVEKGRVVLRGNADNEKLLRDSTSKLDSIARIIDHELDAQGVLMRAVVLMDHIRKEAFPTPGEIDPPLVKLGVVPVFEMLRRTRSTLLNPSALTGSLVIIPLASGDVFHQIAVETGIEAENLGAEPLLHDPNFLEIRVRDSDRQRVVAAVTALFQRGEINCLIGTAALLGEGWDAPAINTLVLASVIGSFVMSNQMRGRAIRADPKFPDKTANIWHVATLPPEMGHAYEPGTDFAKLRRRFEAFHGVGFEIDDRNEAVVENGWQRLGLADSIRPEEVRRHNRRMFREAEQREKIEFVWKRAIDPAREGRFLRPVRELNTPRRLAASKLIVRIGGAEKRGIRFAMAEWMERRRMRKIAAAVFAALNLNRRFDAEYHSGRIEVDVTPTQFQVSAPGLLPADQVTLITSLEEFFDVFSGPRYLIHQGDRFYGVPKRLGEKKALATDFSKRLRRSGFGRHELIHARSAKGKTTMLEARKQRMLNHFDFRIETRISWKTP